MENTLAELANKYNTDKGYKHNYTGAYEKHFKNIRNDRIDLLEIGISQGSSLLMWKDYFPNGKIIGMDIFQGEHYDGKVDSVKNKLIDNDIEFIIGSQTDLSAINEAVSKSLSNCFDIVIDDASHRPKDQQITMSFLLPFVKSGGYYIIEDLDYRCDPKESTLSVIKNFQKTGKWNSTFLDDIQNSIITDRLNQVKLYRDDKIVFFR